MVERTASRSASSRSRELAQPALAVRGNAALPRGRRCERAPRRRRRRSMRACRTSSREPRSITLRPFRSAMRSPGSVRCSLRSPPARSLRATACAWESPPPWPCGSPSLSTLPAAIGRRSRRSSCCSRTPAQRCARRCSAWAARCLAACSLPHWPWLRARSSRSPASRCHSRSPPWRRFRSTTASSCSCSRRCSCCSRSRTRATGARRSSRGEHGAGRLIALAAAQLLWPVHEPSTYARQLADLFRELRAMLAAATGDADPTAPEWKRTVDDARRRFGVAVTNAEATMQRLDHRRLTQSAPRGSGDDHHDVRSPRGIHALGPRRGACADAAAISRAASSAMLAQLDLAIAFARRARSPRSRPDPPRAFESVGVRRLLRLRSRMHRSSDCTLSSPCWGVLSRDTSAPSRRAAKLTSFFTNSRSSPRNSGSHANSSAQRPAGDHPPHIPHRSDRCSGAGDARHWSLLASRRSQRLAAAARCRHALARHQPSRCTPCSRGSPTPRRRSADICSPVRRIISIPALAPRRTCIARSHPRAD